MDPTRIQMISKWRQHLLKTYHDIQVFLGFCNFYRHFIYGFISITRPLYHLLYSMKKGKKPGLITNNWQKREQESFE